MKCPAHHPTPDTTLNALTFGVTKLPPPQLHHILLPRAHSLIPVLQLAQRTSMTSCFFRLVWPRRQSLHLLLGTRCLPYVRTASSHTSRTCRSWLWMSPSPANLPACRTVAPTFVLQMIHRFSLMLLKSAQSHWAWPPHHRTCPLTQHPYALIRASY